MIFILKKIYRFISTLEVYIATFICKIKMLILGVNFDKSMRCFGKMFIRKSKGSNIVIGKKFVCRNKTKYNCAGINHESVLVALDGGQIIIKDNVGISGVTIVSYKKILIEKDVLIGVNTKIYDSDFHSIIYEERKNRKENVKTKEVVIGEGTFVGANVIILKGSKIGKYSVIGAGSVVSGEFKDKAVIVGNPARVIGYLD